MAGSEKEFKGVTIGKYTDNTKQLTKDLHKHVKGDVVFFCVGTDRLTGDSFAPFIGTMLEDKGYKNVIGTIDFPVHAENIEQRIKEIPEGSTVIALDACLGKTKSVGKLILNSGSLYAGKGVEKDLPPVGDFHILGIVNVDGGSTGINFKLLSGTRLSMVLKMVQQCTEAIENAFPLKNKVKKFEDMKLKRIN